MYPLFICIPSPIKKSNKLDESTGKWVSMSTAKASDIGVGYAEREKLWPILESNLGQSGSARTDRTITNTPIGEHICVTFFKKNYKEAI